MDGPFDPVTGTVRVLSKRCDTCIFRPGNLMRLQEGRVEAMVAEALESDSAITCHSTLPYGSYPDAEQAICRGFWARHRDDTVPLRLAQALEVVRYVDPPSTEMKE